VTSSAERDAIVDRLARSRLPITFAIDGCPLTMTSREHDIELRPVGRLDEVTCEQVRRAVDLVLHTDRPISVILTGLDIVDLAGAQMITDLLERLLASGRLAAIVGLDQHTDRTCRAWPSCGCDALDAAVSAANRARSDPASPADPE
jgi:anti-anti-sigma regulatory factor